MLLQQVGISINNYLPKFLTAISHSARRTYFIMKVMSFAVNAL